MTTKNYVLYLKLIQKKEEWKKLYNNDMVQKMYKTLYGSKPIFGIKHHLYYIITYYIFEKKNILCKDALQISQKFAQMEEDINFFNLLTDIQTLNFF